MNKFLIKALSFDRFTKVAIQQALDFSIGLLCFMAAMFLRLERIDFLFDHQFWTVAIFSSALSVVIFYFLGAYRAIIRFMNERVLGAILLGSIVGAASTYALSMVVDTLLPRSVPVILVVLQFLGSAGLRYLIRFLYRGANTSNRTRVLIYGAGESGRQLANALQHTGSYHPVGFLDDDPALHDANVAGLSVFDSSKVAKVAKQLDAEAILLAIPSAPRKRRREIVAKLEPLDLEIRTMPGVSDLISGKLKVDELVRVSPEQLLGRDPVPPNPELMAKNIRGKVVLVSGAGGSIGSELCRQIIKYAPRALILLEVSEFALYKISLELRESLKANNIDIPVEGVLGSVQNIGRVTAILKNFGVQTVYHAAAYKHVVLVEENVVEGIRNNVFGTRTIAKAASDVGVENFILISTDKAVRPTNFMGASKRMAELVCQSLQKTYPDTVFSMVRFGNVLGSSGSVIPRFQEQINRGGPVTVTHKDITRFFMTIPEAAQLVIQASAMAKGGDVFVLDMGEPVKILDLASTMIRLHGLKPYLENPDAGTEAYTGDIAIKIVGLNKGEKLYEELLIGDNPQPTSHARIMTATEVSMTPKDLDQMLDTLLKACLDFDLRGIQSLFLEAPLAYKPTTEKIHDLMWNMRIDEDVKPKVVA